MSETRDLRTAEAELDDDFDDDEVAPAGLYAEAVSCGFESATRRSDAAPPPGQEFCSTETPDANEGKGTKDAKDDPVKEEPQLSEFERMQQVQFELQRVGYHLENGLKILQDQMSNKIPSPDRTGQPPLRDQIRDLNKEIDRIAKKSSPYATTEEKIEITKDLQKALMQVYRIQYGLPPALIIKSVTLQI